VGYEPNRTGFIGREYKENTGYRVVNFTVVIYYYLFYCSLCCFVVIIINFVDIFRYPNVTIRIFLKLNCLVAKPKEKINSFLSSLLLSSLSSLSLAQWNKQTQVIAACEKTELSCRVSFFKMYKNVRLRYYNLLFIPE
jgi:hypothetical protein